MIQPWYIFAFLNIIAGSIASLYIRLAMKKEENDPILFAIFFQFTLSFIVFIFALYRGFVFPPLVTLWPHFLLSGMLYAMGTLCNFRASKHIPAGEMTIITSFGSVVSIILAVWLMSNKFTVINIVGVVLILSSILILYAKEKIKINKGFWYAVGLAVFYGSAVVNDTYILRFYDAVSYVAVMCFIPGLFISIFFPGRLFKLKKLMQFESIKHVFLYSFFYAVAAITYYIALGKGVTVSQLSPISRASIIVTVFFGAIFLKERKDMMRKIISAALVTGGVYLLL